MRIMYVTLAGAVALLVVTVPAAAQVFCSPTDETTPAGKDVAACWAATTTPFGALPTILPASLLGRTLTRLGFNIGFGSMDEEGPAGRRNLGIGVEIPAGRASLGFTGGLVDYTCDAEGFDAECKSAIMLGGRFATPLLSSAVGAGTGQSSFFLGLNGSAGFSNGDVLRADFFGQPIEVSGRSFSVGLGLPIGLVAKSGTVTITPFVEPAFFWGQTKIKLSDDTSSESDSESGTGFALGGGLSLGFANGVALDVGFKKVMIDEANAVIGVGLSLQR